MCSSFIGHAYRHYATLCTPIAGSKVTERKNHVEKKDRLRKRAKNGGGGEKKVDCVFKLRLFPCELGEHLVVVVVVMMVVEDEFEFEFEFESKFEIEI